MLWSDKASQPLTAGEDARLELAVLELAENRQLVGTVASAVIAVLMFLIIASKDHYQPQGIWLAAFIGMSALRAAYVQARHKQWVFFSSRKARNRVIQLLAVASGFFWSIPVFLVNPQDSFSVISVVFTVGGVITAAVSTFAGRPRAMAFITLLPMSSLIYWFTANMSPVPFTLIAIFVIFSIFIGVISYDTNRRLREALRLRFENVDLVESLKESQRHVLELANRDELTKLPNRRLLAEFFKRAESEAKRHGFKLAVLYIDLDNFKPVNDRYGHDVGDEVLIQVAAALKDALRDVDILARVGGDEFVAVVEGVASFDGALVAAQRLASSLCAPIKAFGNEVTVGASIGIALYPDHGKDLAELMAYADAQMYQAKVDTVRACSFRG